MFVECWAVVVLILIMSFSYLRNGKQSFSIAIIPLIFVPFTHIVAAPLSRTIEQNFEISAVLTHVFLDILAMILACVLFALTALKIKNSSYRVAFLVMCMGFTIIFSWMLILNIVTPHLSLIMA